MSGVSTWSPHDSYVQGGMVDGRFMSAAYCLLAAGPPRLWAVGGYTAMEGSVADETVWTVGIIQSWSLTQQANFMQIFEVGSDMSYFIRSRTMNMFTTSRVWYHGPSMLRAIYAYYDDSGLEGALPPTVKTLLPSTKVVANPHDVRIPPGYENFFINLHSDLFSQPVGLLIRLADSNMEVMGQFYLENVYVAGHTIGGDAQGVILSENVNFQFQRVVPVQTGTEVPLIAQDDAAETFGTAYYNGSTATQLITG